MNAFPTPLAGKEYVAATALPDDITQSYPLSQYQNPTPTDMPMTGLLVINYV